MLAALRAGGADRAAALTELLESSVDDPRALARDTELLAALAAVLNEDCATDVDATLDAFEVLGALARARPDAVLDALTSAGNALERHFAPDAPLPPAQRTRLHAFALSALARCARYRLDAAGLLELVEGDQAAAVAALAAAAAAPRAEGALVVCLARLALGMVLAPTYVVVAPGPTLEFTLDLFREKVAGACAALGAGSLARVARAAAAAPGAAARHTSVAAVAELAVSCRAFAPDEFPALRDALMDGAGFVRDLVTPYVEFCGAESALPADWSGGAWLRCFDDSGYAYWYNDATGDSTWDPPPEVQLGVRALHERIGMLSEQLAAVHGCVAALKALVLLSHGLGGARLRCCRQFNPAVRLLRAGAPVLVRHNRALGLLLMGVVNLDALVPDEQLGLAGVRVAEDVDDGAAAGWTAASVSWSSSGGGGGDALSAVVVATLEALSAGAREALLEQLEDEAELPVARDNTTFSLLKGMLEAAGAADESSASFDAWEAHVDEESGATYYYNAITQESSWEAPVKLPSGWVAMMDEESGFPYYMSASGETTWEVPTAASPSHGSGAGGSIMSGWLRTARERLRSDSEAKQQEVAEAKEEKKGEEKADEDKKDLPPRLARRPSGLRLLGDLPSLAPRRPHPPSPVPPGRSAPPTPKGEAKGEAKAEAKGESKAERKKKRKRRRMKPRPPSQAREETPLPARPGSPSAPTCSLSHVVMTDPVRAPGGPVFERRAILKHLEENGNICPVSGEPLAPEDLRTATDVRDQLTLYHIQRTAAVNVAGAGAGGAGGGGKEGEEEDIYSF